MGAEGRREMSRHERAFRRLVRLYPAAFRAQYEDQMVGLFADQLRDSRTSGASLAIARLWAHTLIDLVVTAPQERLRKESAVLQPVQPAPAPATPARSPLQRVVVVIASVPLILWAAVWIVAPGFMDPVFSVPPTVLGFPLGVVLIALAGGLALVGWLVSRRTRSVRVALGAVAFLTIPALLLIVMTPALVLIIFNLA
jgi:hypothetical protein